MIIDHQKLYSCGLAAPGISAAAGAVEIHSSGLVTALEAPAV